MPTSESWLSSKAIMEQFLPEDAAIESFDYKTCTGSNCFELAASGKPTPGLLVFFFLRKKEKRILLLVFNVNK